MKKILLLLMTLVAGMAAQATVSTSIKFRGMTRTGGNNTFCVWSIESNWGSDQQSQLPGSSYTFNNYVIHGNNSPVTITLNGLLNFQEGTSATDVTPGYDFIVLIESSTLWFYGASVKTSSDATVAGCSNSLSIDKHTLMVVIPKDKTFGYITVDYVPNEPFSTDNTVISGVDDDYIYQGEPIEPEPTVTYNGNVLTKGTDYTVSYAGSNRLGNATVTVTGTGNYAGSIQKSYTLRDVDLSDFNSLGNNTYEIATTTDLDNLARYVKAGNYGNDCAGLTFKQTADIAYGCTTGWNFSRENNFTSVGVYSKPFKGTYNGQNHTISGIRIYKTDTGTSDQSQGLFGYVGGGGTVKNVVLSNTNICGYTNTGGIVGYNSGAIEDCRVESNVLVKILKETTSVGGIAGICAFGGAINRCTFKGKVQHTVTTSTAIGGIVGTLSTDCTVSNCLALDAVVSGRKYSGAIAGTKTNTGILTANYYHNCKVANSNNTAGATVNVGVGIGDGSEDQAGARSVHALTLPSDVTATGESVAIDGVTYYAAATTVTLTYSGDLPEGYQPVYSVDGVAIEGDTLTMPAQDAAVTVTITAIDYTITLPTDLEHGAITCDKATAHFGETVTLTVTPDAGYAVEPLTVMNGDTPLEVTAGANNTYTFVMPATNVTVNASFAMVDYTITLPTALEHATIICDKATAHFGETVMLTVTPEDESYVIQSLTVMNGDTPLEVDTDEDNTYTFVMPAADVTVNVEIRRLRYIFDSATGELTLIWGEFKKSNKWGSDVTASAVTSVTATDEVSFTGDCSELFKNFTNCAYMDLSNVNTAKVTAMNSMFYNCKSLTSLDLSGWNTANVTYMYYMFSGCSSLDSLNLSGWNTANVTRMNYMFEDCTSLTTLDLSGWNTGNVTTMSYMFNDCSSLTALDLSGWNTANVTDLGSMFYNCKSLTSLDLSGWNTANVTYMSGMFNYCTGLTSLNLSGWNTANVTTMRGMFQNCSGLTALDLSGWNTANVTNMSYMFQNCWDLTTIYVGDEWSTAGVSNSENMFKNSSVLVGGNGTEYDASHIDAEYARIDRPGQPGYLTEKSTLALGDLNGDGNVDVIDVSVLIDFILDKPVTIATGAVTDLNGDSHTDVTDVSFLIDMILQ